jgi:His Kinase A (phospho-acceptor) domain
VRPVQPDPSAANIAPELDGLRLGGPRTAAADLPTHALISSARHELRSPLQSVQGFAELLAAESYGALGKDQRVFVEHIIQSTLDLSRALDACFDLIQLELLQISSAPAPVALQGALSSALKLAQGNGARPVEVRPSQLEPELRVDLDTPNFRKAISAIITAVAPLLRGPVVLCTARRDDSIELLFGPDGDDGATPLRDLPELMRRGASSRALLWLRLACALLEQGGARVEASEAYDRIRVLLPLSTIA